MQMFFFQNAFFDRGGLPIFTQERDSIVSFPKESSPSTYSQSRRFSKTVSSVMNVLTCVRYLAAAKVVLPEAVFQKTEKAVRDFEQNEAAGLLHMLISF